MQDIDDNTFLEEGEEDIIYEQEDQIKKNSTEDNIQVIKDVKETRRDEKIDEKIATFLHENDLSETLINTINLTDEHVSDDDIDNLQDLWQVKIDKSSNSIDSTSGSSLFNCQAQLLSNNIYLQKVLSKPLVQALCEIIAKKPADPVEYLGHWLLHYKICEERANEQKERKSKLSIDMEYLKLKKIEEKDFLIERKDEEELGEDRNYTDY